MTQHAVAVQSILDHLVADRMFDITSEFEIKGSQYLAVGLDNGNDAGKAPLLGRDGRLHTVRIPTAHVAARRFQGGVGEVSYQLAGAPAFSVGAAALGNEGRALPVGPTAQRLADLRQCQFLAACLIELLLQAGYAPGAYTLALGFAIPNTRSSRRRRQRQAGGRAGDPRRAQGAPARGGLAAHPDEWAWPRD